jgi:hypothetical protein
MYFYVWNVSTFYLCCYMSTGIPQIPYIWIGINNYIARLTWVCLSIYKITMNRLFILAWCISMYSYPKTVFSIPLSSHKHKHSFCDCCISPTFPHLILPSSSYSLMLSSEAYCQVIFLIWQAFQCFPFMSCQATVFYISVQITCFGHSLKQMWPCFVKVYTFQDLLWWTKLYI